jgi:hypothetical protein
MTNNENFSVQVSGLRHFVDQADQVGGLERPGVIALSEDCASAFDRFVGP